MANPQVQYVYADDKNGLRLRRLMEKATKVLIIQYYQYFSNDPITLFQPLRPHQKLLKNDLRQKIILKDQYELLFPASWLVDSACFDISLLTFLLRQLCGLPEPLAGCGLWIHYRQNTVQKLRQIEIELKAALRRVAHLESCLDGISYDISSPISSFFVRENDFQKIHEDLVNMDINQMALFVTGLGGVGKSEVVRQYCLQYSATTRYG